MLDQQLQQGGFRGAWYLVTLTYRDPADWEPHDVKKCLEAIRKQFQRKGVSLHYVWTAELQKRGAVHYHALVWVPRGQFIKPLDRSGVWSKGLTQIQKARNAVGYLAKYAGKGLGQLCDAEGRELRFPRGCRIQGAGGLCASARVEARWWSAPRWARDRVHAAHGEGVHELRRLPGGWCHKASGEVFPSPWQFIGYTPGLGSVLFQWRGNVQSSH